MVKRQARPVRSVFHRNPEQHHTIPLQLCQHKGKEWRGNRELTEADLDCHFSYTGYAQQRLHRRIADECLRLLAQPLVAADELQEGMDIQQHPHYWYSAKSTSGASKSSAIVT